MNVYFAEASGHTQPMMHSPNYSSQTTTTETNASDFCSNLLIRLFDELFVPIFQTRLCGGAGEPLYIPASVTNHCNEIHFTRDYCASALHEIAHWCVAGPERLKQVDYGYWYAPDGRTLAQQIEFERVEIKPQALEWVFSVACRKRFAVSADNLALSTGPSAQFKHAILDQVLEFCVAGLPNRAGIWVDVLKRQFAVADPLNPCHYQLEDLGG